MINYLNYGLLGLCAIGLILFWRLLSAEQRRPGEPRRRILQLASLFLVLCVSLAGISLFLELRKIDGDQEDLRALQADLARLEHALTTAQAAGSDCAVTRGRLEAQVAAKNEVIDALRLALESLRRKITTLPVSIDAPSRHPVTGQTLSQTIQLDDSVRLKRELLLELDSAVAKTRQVQR